MTPSSHAINSMTNPHLDNGTGTNIAFPDEMFGLA